MTIKEATKNGIRRIRRPCWQNEEAYLRMEILSAGSVRRRGPWMALFDRRSQETIGEPTPQMLLSFPWGDVDDYVQYTGPIDRDDRRPT